MIRETFGVDIQEIPRIKVFLEKNLVQWGVRENDLYDILLACDEAATNIVMHAYRHADEAKKNSDSIMLTVKKKRNVVEVILKDEGESFDPDSTPAPDMKLNLAGLRKGGFGVYLMKSLMNRIRYRCQDGRNITVMLKVLSS